jgi:hypothetical protein
VKHSGLSILAGNTLLYEKLALHRRKVNATLSWPTEAAAARPPPSILPLPLCMDPVGLATSLLQFKDEPVLWVGALFNVSDGDIGETTIESEIAKWDKDVKICPEC